MNRLEEIKERLKEQNEAEINLELFGAADIELLLQEVESLQYKYDQYRETALNRIRFDEDRMNILLQRLERYEKALQHIADRDNCYDDLPMIADKTLREEEK